jgi:choline dehydrogenase-like flavoprotein
LRIIGEDKRMTLDRLDDSGQLLPTPDVQRTTLSLDLMGRYVCNTWDEAVNNGGPPFDVVVIGSGMFGGYCADHLFRKSNLRVLVLDAGPFVVSTHLQNLPDIGLYAPDAIDPATDSGQARNLVWGMPWRGNSKFVGQAYCVGGKSLFWGGWCPTLLDDDIAKWATFSPAVANYLKDNYPILQRQVGILDSSGKVATDYIQGPLFDALKAKIGSAIGSVANLDTCENAPLAVQGAPPASGLFPFDKYSSAFLLVSAVREASNAPDQSRRLFLAPNTHVIKLNTSGGTVTSIQAQFNGAPRTLNIPSSTAVVLALGTIESTRLALYSFPRSSDPSKELMGRNLMVHIRDNVQATIKRLALAGAGTLPIALQAAALLVRGSTAQGKFHLQVTASADLGSNPDALLYSMIPDIDEIDGLLAQETSDNISIWFRGVSESKGDTTTPVPSPGVSYVNLSPFESDEFGVPRAYVQIVQNGDFPLADAMDAATRSLVLKLDPGANLFNYDRDAAGSTYHESGTLWMGDDPATSVTDANGRFHHISNAYCVDQSLFPTVGSVNPTLTGLVLTRKVAEAVIARL